MLVFAETAVREVVGVLSFGPNRFAFRMDLTRNHQYLMWEARKLWEMSDGISSNRMMPQITQWMSQVEGMLTEVTGLDNKYNDRKKHPWKLYHRLRGASLSRDMAGLGSASKFVIFGKKKKV